MFHELKISILCFSLESSEIYSVENDTWRKGPDLPEPRHSGSSVQFENTFLVISGMSDSSSCNKDVRKFDGFQWKSVENATVRRCSKSHAILDHNDQTLCVI